MLASLLVAGLLFAVAPDAVAQQVYKWVDASGNVTYSSTPPPGKTAESIDLPPLPPPAEIEAARERERSLQELGDQLSQDRASREAEVAEQRRAARAEADAQTPTPSLEESGIATDSGWWIPGYPPIHPPVHPPVFPGRPVPPPPGRDPTAPTDHPAYWPREPVLPPDGRPIPPRPVPLPSTR